MSEAYTDNLVLHPAYNDGYEAFKQGKAPNDNPHPLGTTAGAAWSLGWTDGLEQNGGQLHPNWREIGR